jgi:hypothetical protein
MMTPDKARWVARLALLVQPDHHERAVEALTGIVSMIQAPDRVWQSRGCLDVVATSKRKTIIPGLADIQSAIAAWLRDNPEPAKAITDERMAGWTDIDRAWLTFYEKRKGEGFAPRGRANLISLIRSQAPIIIPFLAAQERVEPGSGRMWYDDSGRT